jgi:hypothetical protein
MDRQTVIVVMLRRPRLNEPNEMRTDPLWEFGSFGCTGCHGRNLMNPKRLAEHNGSRFAFVQNGHLGIKLVHITPPVRAVLHSGFGEVAWEPREMPLQYDTAPLIVSRSGESDTPTILHLIRGARRRGPIAQFSSKFRSCRQPLPDSAGRELVEVYERTRNSGAAVSRSYVDALPYPPPLIDLDREATYRRLLCRNLA